MRAPDAELPERAPCHLSASPTLHVLPHCCLSTASSRLQSIRGGPFLRHVTVEQAVSEPPSSIPAATSSSTALTSRCSPATSLTYPTSSLACRRCSPTAHSRRHGTNLFGGLPLSPTPLAPQMDSTPHHLPPRPTPTASSPRMAEIGRRRRRRHDSPIP
jgi:hypothetical protein